MHDSTSKRRQVVLVTSADHAGRPHDGRQPVGRQPGPRRPAHAARRRRLASPALHALFDVAARRRLVRSVAGRSRRGRRDSSDPLPKACGCSPPATAIVDAIHALATEQMQPVFDKLRGEYDFIIIDGAPVLGMSDALIFGQYSDGAILSVRRDHSQMPKINQAAELLRGVGIRVIGAVVNGVPSKSRRPHHPVAVDHAEGRAAGRSGLIEPERRVKLRHRVASNGDPVPFFAPHLS